jgi:hypothetical protein
MAEEYTFNINLNFKPVVDDKSVRTLQELLVLQNKQGSLKLGI